jgi:hypothetical protein
MSSFFMVFPIWQILFRVVFHAQEINPPTIEYSISLIKDVYIY